MSKQAGDDAMLYSVVISNEQQYSIWPAAKENAFGWVPVGKQGNKEECLAYIKEAWADMRPKSLRDQMVRLP